MWPCGVPQGLGRLGPWSSTAACVVGATGYRGGLPVRHADCHFDWMRGAVAIFRFHCMTGKKQKGLLKLWLVLGWLHCLWPL